jgi:hypothetical protein
MKPPASAAPLLLTLTMVACSGAPDAHRSEHGPEPVRALAPAPGSAVGSIEVRTLEAKPRLTLVSRDGDPAAAVVATVATDLGPAMTTALSAVVETRLQMAGLEVDARVDRSAFRVRLLTRDPGAINAFFGILAGAFSRPITPGSPEIQRASQRVLALRKSPLDAEELTAVAACTGRLGLAPGEPLPDLSSPAGARDLEAARRAALHAGRTSIAVVGPTPICTGAASALEQTGGFAPGPPVVDPWPASDAVGSYASPELGRNRARLSIAVRVGDVHAAVAAAERLGDPGSPLLARLATLPDPWRAVEIAGVARPRGGCVSVVVETDQASPAVVEARAARVAALLRQEIRRELAGGQGPFVATRQILTAADPREAAARASWWALSGSVAGVPERWATALGVSANTESTPAEGAPGAPRKGAFAAELDRTLSLSAAAAAERRLAVERGQGELWLLLGSPCGVAEEGTYDAGLTALAALSVVQARSLEEDVTLEPWITVDGIGVLAHAPLRHDRETPAELATRVADAAARALKATTLSPEAVAIARSAALEHLEQTTGRHAAAMEAFASAATPEHPSWLTPFGVWNRVASSGIEAVRLRWQAFTAGPLRVAVLANADASQAAAAAAAVDRWILPQGGDRACRTAGAAPPRTGRTDVRLPKGTPLAQAMIGAVVPGPGAPGHDLAELTALALDGSGGLLESALAPTRLAARASARLLGGSRASALVIDVRAPADSLSDAVAQVKSLLAQLSQTGPTDAALARALSASAARAAQARAEPRRRLVEVWTGRPSLPVARPSLAAWRGFLASSLREGALIVVEARPE